MAVDPVRGIDTVSVASVRPETLSRSVPESRDLVKAVRAVNEAGLLGAQNELTFVLDPRSRHPVLRVINRETREVIQQFPAERVLEMARSLTTR